MALLRNRSQYRPPDSYTQDGKVIIAVTVFDIFLSLLTVIDTTKLPDMIEYPNDSPQFFADTAFSTTRLTFIHLTYIVCALRSYERCIALCLPFRHTSDKIVQNIGKVIVIFSIFQELFNFGAVVAKDLRKTDDSAISSQHGEHVLATDVFNSSSSACEVDRKSTRLNSSHVKRSRMPSSA